MTKRTLLRDGATHTTAYSNHDIYGNPATIVETGPNGGNRTTSKTYFNNPSTWIIGLPKDESFAGSSITRNYDTLGQLLSTTRNGVSTTHAYHPTGDIASTTFPRGLTHFYNNYKRGIPQYETQPESISISRVVSDAGNVTSETNGRGYTTGYAYDRLNRLTGVSPPVGNPVGIAYTPAIANTPARKTVTRGGLVEVTIYDGFGRPTGISLGGLGVNIVRGFAYDVLGRKVFESNPYNTGASPALGTPYALGTSYAYDILDRVIRKTNADGTFSTTIFGAGSKTTTNERGFATTHTYRSYGNPDVQHVMDIATSVASANVSMTRNTRDQLTSATQGGITRLYDYDSRSYLYKVTAPEVGDTRYWRDDANNISSKSMSGQSVYAPNIQFDYDGQNRLIKATYPGINGLATPTVTKTYTKTHKLETVTSTAATRSYTYDANENLRGESVMVDGHTFATGYGYNGNDQLFNMIYPAVPGSPARIVTYNPDVLGRPTELTGTGTLIVPNGIGYYPNGQLSRLMYASNTCTWYGQNHYRLWVSNVIVTKGNRCTPPWNTTTSLHNFTNYIYDGVGNLSSVVDNIDPQYSRTLGFDGIDRLTVANGPWGSGALSYDGQGNLKSQTLGTYNLGYSYSANNRLLSTTGSKTATYTYDTQGNIASDSNPLGGAGSGGVTTSPANTYAYDMAGNLRTVNAGTARQASYGYDGLNQRIWALKLPAPTVAVPSPIAPVKTYEVYSSGGQLLVEFSPSTANNNITKHSEHAYLGSKRVGSWDRVTNNGPTYSCINSIFTLVGTGSASKCQIWINGQAMFIAAIYTAGPTTTSTQSHFHLDPAGTPLVATSATGALLWKENHRPYGDKLNYQPAASSNTIGYAGKPYDNATGLSYMWARYYHPALGRFMAMNPVGFQEGNVHSHNRYTYANNNPYKFVDPDGRSAKNAIDKGLYGGGGGGLGLGGGGGGGRGGGSGAAAPRGGGTVANTTNNTAQTVNTNVAQTAAPVQPATTPINSGIVAKDGTVVTGFTKHGVDRSIGDGGKRAGVDPKAMLDALKSPQNITTKTDHMGRNATTYKGNDAKVVVNPETGKVVSTNPSNANGVRGSNSGDKNASPE